MITSNITHLIFDEYFNVRIRPNFIPNGIKKVDFGLEFQQDILSGTLPETITHLYMNDLYEGVIHNNTIPKSVKYMKTHNLNMLLENDLPNLLYVNIYDDDSYDSYQNDFNNKVVYFPKYNKKNVSKLICQNILLDIIFNIHIVILLNLIH